MGSLTLNTRPERRKLLNKNTQTIVGSQLSGKKKTTFQLKLNKIFTALEERDDIYNLNNNMTKMIQQIVMSIVKKQINITTS